MLLDPLKVMMLACSHTWSIKNLLVSIATSDIRIAKCSGQRRPNLLIIKIIMSSGPFSLSEYALLTTNPLRTKKKSTNK
jgi:hypothetical protein